ncbi:DEAD/DEAH box helicase family protein [Halocalculus aciditolerans]|uniref:DNA-repair protein n=1 Tax=Halocalculus aciditolerans TaxID=1383812 RepID=A0A830F7P5_9EURY|nr:DEAD/DEAH box helicase family protein [Halocalculus aciditolerans]GGL71354.1 DNA-repair protein [Halocalculus aciditolerans]
MEPESDFTDLELPRVIDTSSDDLMQDFYIPLLSRAKVYRRGVGYFTTNWVRSAARGIAELAENGGTAQWIMSPILEEDDWEALKKGNRAKTDEVLRESLDSTISDLRYDLEYETRNAIAWMIADGLLEIKLAVPSKKLSGDFHDKFGVFYDWNGNRVAFHGSQNDSEQALRNYEAYTIDCDWISDRDNEGVNMQKKRFENLWEGRDENVGVHTIPEGVKEGIAELRDNNNRPYEPPESVATTESEIVLRDYQRDAVDSWFENDNRGLFQMATGTGKTFTALAALDEYTDTVDDPLLCVIAVPQKHLARQWAQEMETFGLDQPKFVYHSANPDWKNDLSRAVSNLELGIKNYECLITTHQTFSGEHFREKVSQLSRDTILIGDEVHGLGSEGRRKGLLDSYDARIGLSATPERYYDEEGSNHLLDYFDGVIYEYPLEDAIPQYLTPYRYHPIIVEMDEDELEDYRQMTQSVVASRYSEDADEETTNILQSQRAEIVKEAINKYDVLRDILRGLDDIKHLLVYTNSEQIDTVGSILNEFGVMHHRFTHEEGDDLREELLTRFGEGEYEALVAMRCLDEGVDVPATRTAILMANTGNPMQFIQRRGRVLRQAPGKDRADIYDLLVVPTLEPDDDIAMSEQYILEKELRRFEEFAETAENEYEARNKIEDVRIAYGI